MLEWSTTSASFWRSKRPLNPLSNLVERWSPRLVETSNRNVRTDTAESHVPLIIAASVSTLGGLLFGYDNIVISGAIGFLSQLFHLVARGVGWAAGCALVGCIVGCVAAGPIADYLGKKKGPALCALCFRLSSFPILFPPNLPPFL